MWWGFARRWSSASVLPPAPTTPGLKIWQPTERRGAPRFAPGLRYKCRRLGLFLDRQRGPVAEAQQTVANQARWLKQYSQYTITIEGHADERGTREYNIALGAKRAQAVRGPAMEPSFVDVADEDHRKVAVFGDADERRGHLAHLARAAGQTFPGRARDGLHRVDDDQLRIDRVDLADDGSEIGLGGEEELSCIAPVRSARIRTWLTDSSALT